MIEEMNIRLTGPLTRDQLDVSAYKLSAFIHREEILALAKVVQDNPNVDLFGLEVNFVGSADYEYKVWPYTFPAVAPIDVTLTYQTAEQYYDEIDRVTNLLKVGQMMKLNQPKDQITAETKLKE